MKGEDKITLLYYVPSIDEIILATYGNWTKIPRCQMGVKKYWCQHNITQFFEIIFKTL